MLSKLDKFSCNAIIELKIFHVHGIDLIIQATAPPSIEFRHKAFFCHWNDANNNKYELITTYSQVLIGIMQITECSNEQFKAIFPWGDFLRKHWRLHVKFDQDSRETLVKLFVEIKQKQKTAESKSTETSTTWPTSQHQIATMEAAFMDSGTTVDKVSPLESNLSSMMLNQRFVAQSFPTFIVYVYRIIK